jgi:hypothetical protein
MITDNLSISYSQLRQNTRDWLVSLLPSPNNPESENILETIVFCDSGK